MKHTVKRVLSAILLVCMLAACLPLSAFAAETKYTFSFATGAVDGTILNVGDGANGWSLAAKSDGTDSKSVNVKSGFAKTGEGLIRWKNQDDNSIVALKLTGIAEGNYKIDIRVLAESGGAAAYIYVMPAAELPGTTVDIQAKIKGMQPDGYVGSYHKGGVDDPTSVTSVAFTGSSDGSYAVVFQAATNSGGSEINKTTFRLISMTLTETSDLPSGITPTAPPTSAPTEPEQTKPAADTDVDKDNYSVYVRAEIAADDCVSSSYFTHAAAGIVNGHDYLYLATRGGKFIVYDIDDKKQIDSEVFDTDTARYVLVDENGIVWVTGGSGFFRYDPFTGMSEIISIDWSQFGPGVKAALGPVSDGNGKIYFGTLNNGYLGCFDTATKKAYPISGWLGIDPGNVNDTKEAGYAGLVYKDGYLYLGIDGDQNGDGTYVHAIIKYDIANRKIVDSLDLSSSYTERKYLDYVTLVDGMLLFSFMGQANDSTYVDITGSKMKLVKLPDLAGHTCAITEELDGKRYFVGYYGDKEIKGIVEYDVATKTSKMMLEGNYAFRLRGQNFVTVEGDDRLPGKSVAIPFNDETAGVINVAFWNPQTNAYVIHEANIGLSGGAGSGLRGMTVDPTGRYIYVGAYGNTGIAKYDVVEGKVVDTFKSFSHQTDDLLFYNDYLYAGNYSAGTITQINPETYEVTPLFTLRYSVFEQCRMHSLAAGDNKIFCGPTPYSGFGGVLVWYDLEKNLTYVAGGPNPEDVYYADTTGLTVDSNVQKVKYTWYNAVTGEAADFDYDDDGKDDVYLEDGTRRFSGPIPGQGLNNLVYKDGYIYGTTTINGASGTYPDETTQAVLFVYDVAAMKVIATCDLADHLEGFTNQISFIDQLAEDPDEPGKFWGVISDTLFTMTFDLETKTFTVKEELSIKKDQYYSLPGTGWGHRDLCFDGEYIYVGFCRNTGTYMVRKNDPSEYYIINEKSPNCMILAADGNLYWTTNEEGSGKSLNTFKIAEKAAPLTANAPIDTAMKLIAALDKTITFKDKAAIEAARKAYDKLTDEQKVKVTNLDILIAAEEAYAKLPIMTAIMVSVAVIVVAGIAVAVILVLKKKKKNNSAA